MLRKIIWNTKENYLEYYGKLFGILRKIIRNTKEKFSEY